MKTDKSVSSTHAAGRTKPKATSMIGTLQLQKRICVDSFIIRVLKVPIRSTHRLSTLFRVVIVTMSAKYAVQCCKVSTFQPLDRGALDKVVVYPSQIQHIVGGIDCEVFAKRADTELNKPPLLTDVSAMFFVCLEVVILLKGQVSILVNQSINRDRPFRHSRRVGSRREASSMF